MKKIALGCALLPLLGVAVLLGIAFILSFFNGKIGANTDIASSALKATPPSALSKPITLKVVTFNIQNLWVVGRHRAERMREIGRVLANLDPDIVGFQENFVAKERALLTQALQASRLAYQAYFPSATMGSGLMIASAFPIRETFFHRYSVSNAWYKLWEGDWWAGKGVALARLELPGNAGFIDFYTTHAQAGYGNAAYRFIREQQMAELGQFINDTKTGTAPAFLTGDMNCRRNAPDYEKVVSAAQLTRAMSIDTSIDHIFAVNNDEYEVNVLDTVPIDERVNGKYPLSDHIGYMSTLRINPAGNAPKAAS